MSIDRDFPPESLAETPVCKRHLPREIGPIFNPFRLGERKLEDPWDWDWSFVRIAWRFRGGLDFSCLTQAAEAVVARHSILLCSYEHLQGGWRHVAGRAGRLRIVSSDVGESCRNPEESAMDLLTDMIWRPFTLSSESPCKVGVVKISSDNYLLAVVIHHAFADAFSVGIFAYELAAFYDALLRGEPSPFAELPLQFFDYLVSVEKWSQTAKAQDELARWSKVFASAGGPSASGTQGKPAEQFNISRELSNELRELALSAKIGVNVVWTAIYQITIARLLAQCDVTMVAMDAGRWQKELTGLIGQLAAVRMFRTCISPCLNFRDALQTIRNVWLASLISPPIPCHLLAEVVPAETVGLPNINFVPLKVVPKRLIQQAKVRDRHMLASLDTSFSTPLPRGRELLGPASGSFLFVVESDVFDVLCGGQVGGFSSAEFARVLEHVTAAVAADPDTSISDIEI
jgi:Condensation domain